MEIRCNRCQSIVPAEHINIQSLIAKCPACQSLFTIEIPREVPDQKPAAASVRRQAVPIPDQWKMENDGMSLTLTHRWFTLIFIFLAFFSVVWDSFLFFWYYNASSLQSEEVPLMTIIMMVFPIAHVAAGIGITYYTIAGFLNRTILIADQEGLRIRHTPLPWFNGGKIPRNEIDQLYTKENRNNGKNGANYTYSVSAILTNGKERKIISGLDTPEQALFVEYELEKFLGITDRPVRGQFSG